MQCWPTLEDMNVCAPSLCSGWEVPVSPVPVIFFLLDSIQAHPCVREPRGLCQAEFAPGLDCTLLAPCSCWRGLLPGGWGWQAQPPSSWEG